ncbi:hypothetical protein [Maribacter polysaccharolyticus]|nr:hypothetical protein [Maribacter polysaccharolyticus]MDE3744016.1 hypothetical protein [Maribacter polysaccharolyticus]
MKKSTFNLGKTLSESLKKNTIGGNGGPVTDKKDVLKKGGEKKKSGPIF